MANDSKLSQVLSPERVSLNANISSKKKLFEEMAKLLASDAELGMKPKDVFQLLLEREKVGNTGIGEGIALPHSRCSKSEKAVMAVITSSEAVDYDSIDKQGVSLAFGLLVPQHANQEHLTLLSKIATMMRVPGRRDQISEIQDPASLMDSIADWEHQS